MRSDTAAATRRAGTGPDRTGARSAVSARRREWLERIESACGPSPSGDPLPLLETPGIGALLAGLDLGNHADRRIAEAMLELAAEEPDGGPTRDAELRLEVAPDAMTASLSVFPSMGRGRGLSVSDLRDALARAGIVSGLDEVAIEGLAASARLRVARAVVARGTPAASGRPARWEIVTVDAPESPAEAAFDPFRLDPHAWSSHGSISAGERVVALIPPIPGVPGRDVRGRELPVPAAVDEAPWIAGEGTEMREDGIYAVIAGEMQRDGRRLSIVPIRVIDGDVDYESGNIDFPGHLRVRGSILDQFSVKCGGTLEVGGAIQGARVTAGGGIHVTGGIAGRDRAVIRTGGDLRAKFIEHARIFAEGDVIVRRSIVHSHVDTMGVVNVTGEQGAIMGGTIRAARGVRCRILGSVAESPVRVRFGEDPRILDEIVALEEALEKRKAALFEIDRVLERFDQPPEILRDAGRMRTRLARDIQALLKSRVEAFVRMRRDFGGEVRIEECVHRGVLLTSHGAELRVERDLRASRFMRRGNEIVAGAALVSS